MGHTHQNPKKIQTERKVQESSKNGQMASETGGQIEKIEILMSVISFIEDTVRRKIEESIKYKSKPEGNIVN